GSLARGIRRLTDPFIKPIERRVLRAGGNPQSAPWWMVGMAVLIGIALISAADWSVGQAGLLASATAAGPAGLIRLLAYWAIALLKLALIVRVIGSWFGIGEYAKWMRPFYLMTEWFLAPMRRIIPRVGPLDITPILAWVLLGFIGSWIWRLA
ncbi:MAG TPA: YggT family protein, partial [Gemmatimonadales bacterium]